MLLQRKSRGRRLLGGTWASAVGEGAFQARGAQRQSSSAPRSEILHYRVLLCKVNSRLDLIVIFKAGTEETPLLRKIRTQRIQGMANSSSLTSMEGDNFPVQMLVEDQGTEIILSSLL